MPPPSTTTLNTELFAAALTDTTQRPRVRVHLQTCLMDGAPPDQRISDIHRSRTLLAAAAENGWDEAVADLLAAGADVHADSDTVLHDAITGGNISIVERLLAAGADALADNSYALRLAAARGHLHIVECLFAAGADVHAANNGALRLAACNGHLPVVERLLAAGADLHAKNDWALCAAVLGDHRLVVECLIDHGADIHAQDEQPLTTALGKANMDTVGILLRHGAVVATAWDRLGEPQKRRAARALDPMASIIPPHQRRDLIALSPSRFPAMRALCTAERRRSTDRRIQDHHRPPKP